MSTIQKALVFIVVVLSVLTAAVTLVLFAQRSNWRDMYNTKETALKTTQTGLDTAKKDLAGAKDAHASKTAELENKIKAMTIELDSAKSDLALIRDDKARLEALAAELKSTYQVLANNMEVLGQRTETLETARVDAEKRLEEARSTAMAAEESLAIADRKVKDFVVQVQGLTDQLADRDEQLSQLQQKVAILETYAPPVGVKPVAQTGKPIYGRVTSLSKDGVIVFISVGSDDGVKKGMMLLIYKTPGTQPAGSDKLLVAKAKVYDVSSDKSAAKIIKPVDGTIAEGDNVTNE